MGSPSFRDDEMRGANAAATVLVPPFLFACLAYGLAGGWHWRTILVAVGLYAAVRLWSVPWRRWAVPWLGRHGL